MTNEEYLASDGYRRACMTAQRQLEKIKERQARKKRELRYTTILEKSRVLDVENGAFMLFRVPEWFGY